VVAKTWVLVAAILGSSMAFIDGTAVNVALPVMQRDLQASSAQMQWVVEAYALFLAALILIGGSLGDVYGRRKMFVIGIALFAVASIACALAANVGVLIAARSLQGVGGALAMPESLALISASFTGDERGRAIGTWSGFASITGAAGPLIGGVLAEHASWRWVFVINVPLAAIVLAIAVLRVPESRDAAASHVLDWTGALLATFGLGALVYGLIRVQAAPDAAGIVSCAAGVALLAGFAVAQQRARHPMLPPAMFASRVFTLANVYTLLLYMAIGGSLYVLPFVLIDAQGYPPSVAGAALLPFVLLQFALSRWSGGLSARIGVRTPLLIGAAFVAVAFVAFALPGLGGSYWTTYFPAAVLLGLGGAFFIAPLTTAVFDASDPLLAGTASAINNAVARTAGLVAIALFGIAQATVFSHTFDQRAAALRLKAATRGILVAQRGELLAGTVPGVIPAVDRLPLRRRAPRVPRRLPCGDAALVAGDGRRRPQRPRHSGRRRPSGDRCRRARTRWS
jgi:EmrB/QacA subfamily drug resistance transporter